MHLHAGVLRPPGRGGRDDLAHRVRGERPFVFVFVLACRIFVLATIFLCVLCFVFCGLACLLA